MQFRPFRKEKISIKAIGFGRFWIGLIVGIVSAVILSLVFHYTREALRFVTSISADLIIPGPGEVLFFNYFFSLLAAILGLSMTIWIWMGGISVKSNSERMKKRLAGTNSLVIFWIILMIIARFATINIMVLFSLPGYDNELDLYREFWLLYALIPIVVFLQNWSAVRLTYRSKTWISLSIPVCIVGAIILHLTTTIDQEILNNKYRNQFASEYQYIDQELANAKTIYETELDPVTVEVLRKWHTGRSTLQIWHVQSAFSQNHPVSMDTLILQKIIIRNFKNGGYRSAGYYNQRWDYAFPNDIMRQIHLNNPLDPRTDELFNILREQINLINTDERSSFELNGLSYSEKRKEIKVKFIPKYIIFQLKAVRDSLIGDSIYSEQALELPVIKKERLIKKNPPYN